jgi:RNA polymerase sigma-70 factor, ECF subfamily
MQATTTSASTPSFADWYRANHPGLVEAVLRAVGPPALAAEAVDEAFARAFAGWDRVQAMRSPTGWVYRVAVNEARRQLRRATREQAVLAAAPGPGSTPPPGGEAWLLVHELPVRQRATVVLRHVAGLTEAEVGAALGVTRSTVSSSLAAAYRTLATKLAEDEPRSRTMPDRDERRSDQDWPLRLMVARRCGPDGCDADDLLGAAGPTAVTYGDAVRDTIKVRPGDLVAVADGIAGPEVVWRWWGGTVEAVDGASVTVSRNVTQAEPTDPRRAAMAVAVPDELRGRIDVGELVWFGEEDGRKAVVAVAGPEAAVRAEARFPHIRAAYRTEGTGPG